MPSQHKPGQISKQPQVCKWCGVEFFAYRLRVYCSKPCADQGLVKRQDVHCLHCGALFHPRGRKDRPQKFCSAGCQAVHMSGTQHPNWTGGRSLDSAGYVRVVTGRDERKREHRIVAEAQLGRPLQPDEVVHHKNGDKTDNRPENLEVLTTQEHTRRHQVGRPASPPIVCARCNRERKHYAHGYCHSCYSRVAQQRAEEADPTARDRRLEIKRQSYQRCKARRQQTPR
jgi:hypothetical protein